MYALYGVSARPLRELVFVLAYAAAGNQLTFEDQTCRMEYFGVLPTHHAPDLPLYPPPPLPPKKKVPRARAAQGNWARLWEGLASTWATIV